MKLDTEIIYLLGNKKDLINEREVKFSEGEKVSLLKFILSTFFVLIIIN